MRVRKRVLVVDDEPRFASTLREALDMSGYACAAATSTDAAVDALRMNTFDVVITDLHLGSESGERVLLEARATCPGAVCILASGSSGNERETTKARGLADGFLEKPFTLAAACALIEELARKGA